DHLEPIWFYVPLLFLGLLPVSLLLVPFVRFIGTGEGNAALKRTPAFGFALLAGLWCVLFFSLSGCKLPTYILPAFPPLALALGHFLGHAPSPRPRWAAVIVLGGLTFQLVNHYGFVPWYAAYRSPLGHWDDLVRHCTDLDTPVVCYPRSAHCIS